MGVYDGALLYNIGDTVIFRLPFPANKNRRLKTFIMDRIMEPKNNLYKMTHNIFMWYREEHIAMSRMVLTEKKVESLQRNVKDSDNG